MFQSIECCCGIQHCTIDLFGVGFGESASLKKAWVLFGFLTLIWKGNHMIWKMVLCKQNEKYAMSVSNFAPINNQPTSRFKIVCVRLTTAPGCFAMAQGDGKTSKSEWGSGNRAAYVFPVRVGSGQEKFSGFFFLFFFLLLCRVVLACFLKNI